VNKDIIKYAVLALGAYLVWRYIQDHGGIDGLFGSPLQPLPKSPATAPALPVPGQVNVIQPGPQVLDLTGLVTHPDVNDSLTGTVKINGVPTTLSIIQADGRIFGTAGTEVTDILAAKGVNLDQLRQAFQRAQGVAGLGAYPYRPAWLM
jgi:hypothetical protein